MIGLPELVENVLDINIGIFLRRSKREVLLRRRKLLLIRVLKKSQNILELIKDDPSMSDECDILRKRIIDIKKELGIEENN